MLSSSSILLSMATLLGFLVALFVGSKLLPGTRVELADAGGASRVFKLNGLALFLATVLIVSVGQVMGWFSLAFLYNHFVALFIWANVVAFSLAGWLYWRGSSTAEAPKGPESGLARS